MFADRAGIASALFEHQAVLLLLVAEPVSVTSVRDPEAAWDLHVADALTAPLLSLLIDLRARLRKEKNFGLADEIRDRLTELGVTLEDRPDSTRWRIESRR